MFSISYCSSDSNGSPLRPSITIKKIKMLFPKLKEKSILVDEYEFIKNSKVIFEHALKKYADFIQGKEIEDKWIDIISYYYKTPMFFYNKSKNDQDQHLLCHYL